MRSVFLSHSGKDKQFVTELHRRLKRDGVNCFFDAVSIGWGDNWVRVLERALDECTDVIFVLSPDFCNSEWAEVERTSSMAGDPSGLTRKVRPLMLHDCRHLPNFPRFLRQIQALDVSTETLFETNYPEICHELGGVVVQEVALLSRSELPPVQQLPERHRMPYRSLEDKFVGRVDALWQIYDALHRDSTTILQGVGVVAGTGGLGKSQTAIEYIHRFGAAYQGGVYWVDADRGLSTLISQVSGAAGVEINMKAEEQTQLEQLWRGLNKLPDSLIVLDNFPEVIPLRPYLSTTGRIHTLVTTRRRDITAFPQVQLNMLSKDAGIELLNSGPRQLDHDEAAGLVERLGGLPLALELTKSFLSYRTDVGIPQVVAEMDASGEIDVLRGFTNSYRDELPSRHEIDVAKTFQMSWDLAPVMGKMILRVMAELAPVAVPRKLLRLVLGVEEPTGLKDDFGESVSELLRLSLVELDSRNSPVSHRLIRAFVRYRNGVDEASPFERTVEVVREQMGATVIDPDAHILRYLDLLAPHAEALIAGGRLTADDCIYLLNCVGSYNSMLGRYTVAKRFYANALETAEKAFELGHPSITSTQSNLALALQHLGQLEEARDLLKEALTFGEKTFESGHPTIARRQSNLATVLLGLGQREEARDLLQKALLSDEKMFQSGHPSIARRQSNLAAVLRDMGRLKEAQDLFEQALAAAEKTFEPGHLSIARRKSNLATVIQNLGQLEKARDLLNEALVSNEKTFEPGHPYIAKSQSNLGLVLKRLGRLEEARDLLRKALVSDEKTFPPGHPTIALRRSNLASVLKELEEATNLDKKSAATGQT